MEKKLGGILDTSGPAFPPTPYETRSNQFGGPDSPVTAFAHGMSLRDFFAAQALTGAFRGGDTDIDDDVFARRCYEIADAMLQARLKTTQP